MERSHATVDSRSGQFETLEAAIPAKVAGRVKALVATACQPALARRRLAAASTGEGYSTSEQSSDIRSITNCQHRCGRQRLKNVFGSPNSSSEVHWSACERGSSRQDAKPSAPINPVENARLLKGASN